MFGGFDALPEVLRPLAHEPREPAPQPVIQPPRESLVDCAVYDDGRRLPGVFGCTTALERVREIQLVGREAFVWVGDRKSVV